MDESVAGGSLEHWKTIAIKAQEELKDLQVHHHILHGLRRIGVRFQS